MNKTLAVQVLGLSKKYRYGEQKPYYTLRDTMMEMIKDPFNKLKQNHSDSHSLSHDEFWALKNVSFSIKKGEVVGIIGRNGAGKSTLLKIISRITYPTSGEVRLRGRVASLLEVGTGFHGELTGRENIYLNGAILGMRRNEIKQKMKQIIDFAEIEKFMDTPVKHYSSGMHTRLAFAVAAHLESEILIVDEVLSVGDVMFQKKCLGKIHDVARSGRTVLLVSHNTQSIIRLCTKAILIENGKITRMGDVTEIAAKYLRTNEKLCAHRVWEPTTSAPGDRVVKLLRTRLRNREGTIQTVYDSRYPIGIEIEYKVYERTRHLAAEIVLYNQDEDIIFSSANQYEERWFSLHNPGVYYATCWIPGNIMTEGIFSVRVNILQIQIPLIKHLIERDVLIFQIIDTMEGDSARGHITHQYPGVIRPKLTWNTHVDL